MQQRFLEARVVFLGHAEQVGDDEHGERAGEIVDVLALPAAQEAVHLPVGEAPDELLVLLQALRCDQAHQQGAVVGVHRRVERRELIAHRQRIAVLGDDVGDVVAVERHRKSGERTGHRRARRERGDVVEHGVGLLVTRHHHHVVMRLSADGTFAAQCLVVRVRIGDRVSGREEVDVDVAHVLNPSDSSPRGVKT